MIPTLNQSKCLRMLEEWTGRHKQSNEPKLCGDGIVALQTHRGLYMEELTNLVLLAHLHGVTVGVLAAHSHLVEIIARVPESDPPSLTKLRRRAHAGRLSVSYAKEREEGK